MVAFAKGHKSIKVIIAFAEQSDSCLDISSKKQTKMKYSYNYESNDMGASTNDAMLKRDVF